jgi:hypothetical protein
MKTAKPVCLALMANLYAAAAAPTVWFIDKSCGPIASDMWIFVQRGMLSAFDLAAKGSEVASRATNPSSYEQKLVARLFGTEKISTFEPQDEIKRLMDSIVSWNTQAFFDNQLSQVQTSGGNRINNQDIVRRSPSS